MKARLRVVLLIATAVVGVVTGLIIHDLQTPVAPKAGWSDSGGGFGLDVISCASASWCAGLQSLAGQNAAMTWTGRQWTPAVSIPPYEDYVTLSCPAAASCLALTSNGGTLRLANGTWRLGAAYDAGLTGPAYASPNAALSCSSVDACVAVNGAGDEVTLGAAGWTRPASIDAAPLTGVSCPAPGTCIASDGEGRVVTSHAGRFGNPRKVAPDALQAVACASAEFCAVADLDGEVRVGDSDRLGPPHRLGPPAQPIALACPSAGICIAAGPNGAVSVLSGGSWHVVRSTATPVSASAEGEAISCPAGSSDFCAVADGFDDVRFGGAPFS